MTRMWVGVAALLAVAVAVLAGVAPAAVAQENPTPGNETATSDGETVEDEEAGEEDPVLELQQTDNAHIDTIERYDGYAIVTIDAKEPITVTYPTQTRDEIGPNEEREIIAEKETIPEGETEIRVALTGGSVFFGVDGATVQVSGDKSVDTEVVTTLSPTPALVTGAAAAALAMGYVAYRQRTKELEEPVRAHEVWRRK
ncbi:hypothetical protein BDK61_1486 [Haloarcula quadrata]|uniref:Uncharacterized protein n=1 Tax=Haloarcula quadrata TaxID=182779 RepID=A0A495R545_9EURY|nr:hypothetical protein [Haloarcula quadrata]RKS82186.1 hypothetical protein BDK61_1486 [Haloarcula quadrata]